MRPTREPAIGADKLGRFAREEPTQWDLAIRPLRRRGLLAILAAAEVLLFNSYDGRGAALHWAIPFLVGLLAAAVVNLTLLALKGAPVRGQLLCVLGLHLYAMAPDLLSDLPHAGWMDVFLGHVSARAIPGGAAMWLAVAIVVSGAYGWVLSHWPRARQLEAAAGMAPGVGLSGDALTRPQRSPAVTTLAHRGSVRGDGAGSAAAWARRVASHLGARARAAAGARHRDARARPARVRWLTLDRDQLRPRRPR